MRIAGREIDLDQLAAVCRRYGIAELAVFGSVARGEERPDSDLDLYYVLAPGVRDEALAEAKVIYAEAA